MPHGFAHRSFARRAVLRKGRAARRLRCSGGFDCACCITIRYAGSHVVRGARRREWRRSGNWAFPDGAQARGAFSSCLRKSCCGPMAVLLRSYCPQQSYRPTVPLSYRLAAPSPYRPTAAILLQPYGSSSGFEMAQNRRCLPILALGRNECASHGMNAAHSAAFHVEKGQYRRYCAKRKAVGMHRRPFCVLGGGRVLIRALRACPAQRRRILRCPTAARRRPCR